MEDLNIVSIQLKGATKRILLDEKTFSTGSRGYNGVGKIETADGKKYQLNILAIEIGSKPKTPKHNS